MKSLVIPGNYPETEAMMEGLGFSIGKTLKKVTHSVTHPPGSKTLLKLAAHPPSPAHLIAGGGGRRTSAAGKLAEMRARYHLPAPAPPGARLGAGVAFNRAGPFQLKARGSSRFNPNGVPKSGVLTVSTPENAAVLADLGFSIGKTLKKVVKTVKKAAPKIIKGAAIAAATYYGGGALIKSGVGQKVIGAITGGTKKITPALKTVAQAQNLPVAPGSVDYQAAYPGLYPSVPTTNQGIYPGSPQAPYYGLTPATPSYSGGEAYGGVTATAAPGAPAELQAGISPMVLLIAAGVAIPILMSAGRRSGRR
jgi:hypothetical protein